MVIVILNLPFRLPENNLPFTLPENLEVKENKTEEEKSILMDKPIIKNNGAGFLEIKKLSVRYGSKFAVRDLSLSLCEGEAISFVGESGSGKTTVVRAIMGLLPKAAVIEGGSSIRFMGEELINAPQMKLRRLRGSKISMIFQDSGNMLNPVRSVGSQFAEYIQTRKRVNKREALMIASGALYKTGLSDPELVLKSFPFALSGGMRQRVGVAMAMVFSPALLLADEPTSSLDATTQKKVIEELAAIKERENMTVILVTHNLGVASYVSDRIIVLKDGEIVEEGTPLELLSNPKSPHAKELLAAAPRLETRKGEKGLGLGR
jgi:ABC-type glutathione transport system ATPase component